MTNPVATYTPNQNYTLVDPTTYKTGLDSNSIVNQRTGDMFCAHQQATANMTLVVEPGHIFDGVTLTEIGAICQITTTSGSTAATVNDPAGILTGMVVRSANTVANDTITISGSNITLATNATATSTVTAVFMQKTGTFTAPIGNPRIDRIVADRLTGVISVITGTPAATPAAPAITSGKVPIARVLIQTSSTSITNSMVTDERDISAYGRGLAGELNLGAWVKNDGSNNLTLDVNASLHDNGSGKLATAFTTEGTIASGATTDLGTITSNIISITGATGPITSFGNSASTASPLYVVRFTGAPTITHGANIITPGNADIVCTAGTTMFLKFEGSSVWRILEVNIPGIVTAGTYNAANVTVDKTGQITAIAAGTSAGQLIKVTYFPSSQTWTKQAATNSIEVELWGAGGGTTGDGGNSSFDVMAANGGQRVTTASVGGSASGGDLNIAGQGGGVSNSSGIGSMGGSSPRGGQGGTASQSPTAPGGGAPTPGLGYSAAGGGYSYKFYKNTAPSSVVITIGVGGTGSPAGAVGGCLIKEYT